MNVNHNVDDNFFFLYIGLTKSDHPHLEPKPIPEHLAIRNSDVPQVGFQRESNLDPLDGDVDPLDGVWIIPRQSYREKQSPRDVSKVVAKRY